MHGQPASPASILRKVLVTVHPDRDRSSAGKPLHRQVEDMLVMPEVLIGKIGPYEFQEFYLVGDDSMLMFLDFPGEGTAFICRDLLADGPVPERWGDAPPFQFPVLKRFAVEREGKGPAG